MRFLRRAKRSWPRYIGIPPYIGIKPYIGIPHNKAVIGIPPCIGIPHYIGIPPSWGIPTVSGHRRVLYCTILDYIIYTLQLWRRWKILSKPIFASCVWYSDRAYYGLCVLIKDIGRRLPLQLQWSYQGQQGDVGQSVRGNCKTRFWGGQNLHSVYIPCDTKK